MRTFTEVAPSEAERVLGALTLGAYAVLAGGCLTKKPPEAHFYDQHIQPILKTFCVGNTSPCHAIDPGDGTALGNLDLTSFEGIQKRRDVLRTYGSYPAPAAAAEGAARSRGRSIYLRSDRTPVSRSERDPARGRQADRRRTPTPTSSSSAGWTTAPTATASRPPKRPDGHGRLQRQRCRRRAGASRSTRRRPAYQTFVDDVQPLLQAVVRVRHLPQLAAGRLLPDLRRRRRADGVQLQPGRRASSCRRGTRSSRARSCCVRLSPLAGGVSHTGGVFFQSRDDDDLEDAARLGGAGAGETRRSAPVVKTAGETFFEDQRDAEAAPARLRARGVPQPRRLQRLPAALGRQRRRSRRCALRRNYEARATSSWRSTPSTSSSRAR